LFQTDNSLSVLMDAIPTKPDYLVGSHRGPFLDHYYFLFIFIICQMCQIFFSNNVCRWHNFSLFSFKL